MSEIMIFLEITRAEKIAKNTVLGINNVDSKAEPNVQKIFFLIIYPFLRWLLKNDVLLKKFFMELLFRFW